MKRTILALLSCFLFAVSNGQIYYSDVANNVGIDHSYAGILGGGVSFVDFNNDGLDDLTLATGSGEKIHFYKNTGSEFVEIPLLVPHQEEAKQVLWVDFDNDGDYDLYVATYDGVNRLYENTGNLNFTDITETAGLPMNNYRTFGACFGDYDRDGWLDLYYCERIPFMTAQNQHRLFRNNADGTFTDVTETAQTADGGKVPFCSAFLDYNNDRWPDIYTAHDKVNIPNTLLENNGDGTFTDVSVAANADLNMDAMCVNPGDYNNDGWIDIYVTNTPTVGSALLHNIGATSGNQVKFGNAAVFAGVSFTGHTGWGSVFLDADNDGDLDLYVSAADYGDNAESNAFFLNNGNNTFQQPEAGFEGDTTITYNTAIGDFNQDGFPDIAVINQQPFTTHLWQNTGGDHSWIKLKLQGVRSNRDAIGSRIEVYSNSQYQMRYTLCGNGFMGQNSLTETIGLKTAEKADSIIVTWPTGHIDRWYDLEAGQAVAMVEGSTTDGVINVDPDVELTIVTSAVTQAPAQTDLFNLYPSPASQIINIELVDLRADGYTLMNYNGRIIRSGKIKDPITGINIQHLPAGTYFVVVTDRTGKQFIQKWWKF